jgi:hypothetical protein
MAPVPDHRRRRRFHLPELERQVQIGDDLAIEAHPEPAHGEIDPG